MRASALFVFAVGTILAQAQQYVISTYAGGGPLPAQVPGNNLSIDWNSKALAIDANGNVYFTSLNCVFRLDRDGTVTRIAGNLKDKAFRGFPLTKVPFDTWKSKDGGWPSRYTDSFNVEFTTEQGIRVSGNLFVPRDGKPSHPAMIYFKGADDVIYPVDYDQLLAAFTSHVVLVLHPRAVDYPGVTNYKMSNIRMTTALIGATVESMQLWDLLRSVDYLVEGEGLKLDGVSVYGRKHMGALGFYAAALDTRITRVILDDPPSSHWQAAPLLNVLRVTDLPEAAGLVAPREIVSLTPMPAPYSYTSAIYALYGKKGSIRVVGDLGQALSVWK